jgi:hypothetical protein
MPPCPATTGSTLTGMTEEFPSTCNNCGADRTGVPAGEPCPACGSVNRTVTVGLTANVIASAGDLELGVGYNKDRPWQELWRSVLRRQEELARCYEGTAGPQADPKDVSIDFCKDCWHLKDHLKTDGAVPEAVQNKVEARANNRHQDGPATRLAGHVANTAKHGADENYTQAFIGKMTVTGDKRTFRIDWIAPNGTTGDRDALDLASAAVDEWRKFFADNGLDEAA